MAASLITAVIHYQTPELLRQAVDSFCGLHPEESLLIVDNGSRDGSAEVVRELSTRWPGVTTQLLSENIYHGPAMHRVLQETDRDLVFFLDSDTITRRSGFLPEMSALASGDSVLAAGQVAQVDKRGFATSKGIPVPVSAYMMVHVGRYRTLPPFRHHGLPVLETCREAQRQGLGIEAYPVEDYVEHLGRGTAGRFGYGLGLRSRLEYLLHRMGI